jgi:hypothetical protein
MGKKRVPVVDELFVWSDDGVNLVGSRCLSCNSYYFPKTLTCKNPYCKEKNIENVLLSRHGKLYSYTIQEYAPPPPFKMEPLVPFAIGLIELPEKIRVMGMITGVEFQNIRLGIDMELTIEKLYENQNGEEVVTYKFKPVE